LPAPDGVADRDGSEHDLGIAAYLAGENAFTYGLLSESELHRGERLQAPAGRVWKRASGSGSRYRRRMR